MRFQRGFPVDALSIMFLLAACGPHEDWADGQDDPGDNDEEASHELAGDDLVEQDQEESALRAWSGNGGKFWPGAPPMIQVCWNNAATPSDASFPAGRKNADAQRLIRAAIEGQWQRFGRLNFVGWGDCAAAPAGRRIEVRLDPTTNAGQCPFNSNPTATAACFIGTHCFVNGGAGTCMNNVALHEFGHAIGFYHEEEKPNYNPATYWPGGAVPAGCEKQRWCRSENASSPDTCPNIRYFGDYDPQSIMSYCASKRWPGQLSPGDVASIQRSYGRRLAGQFVTPLGNCLAGRSATGEGQFIWDCDEFSDDQEYYFDASGRIRHGTNSAQCISAAGQGQVVTSRPCSEGSNTYTWKNTEVRAWGGTCIDLPGGNTTNRAVNLQTWDCGALGGANQRWKILGGASPHSRISFGETSKCITVDNVASLANGGGVWLEDCSTSTRNQIFEFRSNGQVKVGNRNGSDYCLDVSGPWDSQYLAGIGIPGDGRVIQVWQCTDAQFNQKFWFSGNIVHDTTGLCLDRWNAGDENGVSVQLWPCNGTVAQRWDYYVRKF